MNFEAIEAHAGSTPIDNLTSNGVAARSPNGQPVQNKAVAQQQPQPLAVSVDTGDHHQAEIPSQRNDAPIQSQPQNDVAPSLPASSLANQTVDSSTGPVLTPFIHPHPSSILPTPATLTSDQQTKYTSLLAAVCALTEIPDTASPQSNLSPLTQAEKLWLTRDCLLRYLRASKWSVQAATTRLISTLTWRREYGLSTFTAEYISEENETGKQVILGYDNAGRPCLYLNPHKQNTKGKEKQLHHLVYMLERCIDIMPAGVENLVLLANFTESRKGQGASVSQGRQTLAILQNHYPERLGRALMQEVPWLVWGFFKAISPFIDPLTKEKLKFDENLRQLVPPAQLIKSYGGDVDFVYDHGRYWPALNALADQRKAEMVHRWKEGGAHIGESEAYLRGTGQSVGATQTSTHI